MIKHQKWIVSPKIESAVLGVLLIVLLSGCAAHFAPAYDPQTAAQIATTYKAVTEFYVKLADTPEASRSYANLASDYEDVAVEMKALVWRTNIQAHNQASNDMAQRLLKDWTVIQARNKKRIGYPDASAAVDQHRLDALLTNLASVESFKQAPAK